jgi:hypothetical protein
MAQGKATRRPEPARRTLPRWSQPEIRVVDRHVRALVAGRYRKVAEAIEACRRELTTLYRSRGRAVERPWNGVYATILQRRRALGIYEYHHGWTQPELAVLKRHLRLLRGGRHVGPQEAAAACHDELAQLRRTQPQGRLVARRTMKAVFAVLGRQARAAGLPIRFHKWTTQEEAILDRTAKALARGWFPSLPVAVAACRGQLAGLRRLRPASTAGAARGLTAVTDRLRRRAHSLGWRWASSCWNPAERRVMDGYVRRLASGRYETVRDAAHDCHKKLKQVRAKLAKARPGTWDVVPPRTLKTIETYLVRWSRARGRIVRVWWSPKEDSIVRSYARGVIKGRFKSVAAAAQECRVELGKRSRRRRARQSARFGSSSPRTLWSVKRQLCRFARALHRPWPGSGWTGPELAACRRWVRWYDLHRRTKRLCSWTIVGEGLQEELERMNSRRSVPACRARVWEEWRLQHGLA